MSRPLLRWAPLSLTALALAGCTAPPPADGGSDGRVDATPSPGDAREDAAADASATDSDLREAGATDAGATDADGTDAGATDAGPLTPVDRDFCTSGREAPGLRAPDGFGAVA